MPQSENLLQAVADAARIAGDKALSYFRARPGVEWKADGTPVTIADREAELVAREWIMQRFPDDGILGEEHGEHNPGAELRWIVDPIDGTKSFIHGVPLWGTLVAVARGEDVIAGAVYCPAVNDLVVAERGAGCWWNGTRTSVSRVSDLAQATVLTTDPDFAIDEGRLPGWRALARRARLSRGWGDCFGYLLVATGRAEVMVDPRMSPWDAAALMPVIQEAGGTITDWSGRVTAFGGSTIATNAALAREARSLLGVPGENGS